MVVTILLFAILFFVLIAGIEYFRQRNKGQASQSNPRDRVETEVPAPLLANAGCCGKHDHCELADKPRSFLPTIEYYDDEELDAFSGKTADSYTPEETALFREIVDTMPPDDMKGWLFSLQQRDIALPGEIEATLRVAGRR